MNTAEFARKLGVSTKTVRKWIKNLNLTCEKNEYGHYVFEETDLPLFEGIRNQVKSGVPSDKIVISTPAPRKGTARKMVQVSDKTLSEKLNEIMKRIEENERQIEGKASDVVSYQLLQHRKEIDELQKKMQKLEAYIDQLEREKEELLKQTAITLEKVEGSRRRKKVLGFLF
ncbi:MerR family transcriptional regulator [Bacillus timonensis]|uniref:MerR family transcriptional regulator n=1 Tax=Bacillus timonensis TaxID=1033734 RepID=UPI000287B7B1|nr:MerR family transcriptional regulator [Bacillus timonensis]